MKSLIIFIGIITTAVCMASSTDTIPASDSLIEYTGRIDFSDSNAPIYSYSGVSIRARFTGTSIAMIMNDNIGQNYYNIILDGKILDTIHISVGKKSYSIAESLENTFHNIEIYKRTEEMFGKTQFFGFIVDEGSEIVPIDPIRSKMIEYIGNSITCGYGNEGANGAIFGATTENHFLTYAAITSRNFNARHLAVCKSGIGIYRNYAGPETGSPDNMVNNYTRIFLNDENPKYNFIEQPDLVCIDLGTNDFNTPGGDSAKFINNYFRLIDTIQTKYTMPNIICLLGPMLSGTTLTDMRSYLEFIADSANKKGRGEVHFFEMSAQTGDLGFGTDYHPSIAQHHRNARELTNYIKTLKGWKINPSVVTASVNEAGKMNIVFNTPVTDNENGFLGFEVYCNGQFIPINSVNHSLTDSLSLTIIMDQLIKVGDKIELSYNPGTIKSIDSITVVAINRFSVLNNLKETSITKGITSVNGLNLILTFNKKLKQNSVIEGLSITNNHGNVEIDSFKINSNKLTLYLRYNIFQDELVFATYTGSGIYGIDDILLNTFSDFNIQNSSSFVSNLNEKKTFTFSLYPNPNSSGRFFYSFNQMEKIKEARFEIYNTHGEILYSKIPNANSGEFDIDRKLTNGVYFFKIILDQSVYIKPILIQ